MKTRPRNAVVFAFALATTALTARARAYHGGEDRWTPQTAWVQRPGVVEVGILSADVGIVRGVAVGTDTLPWAATLLLPVVVPNAHIQISPLAPEPIAIAVRGGVYYASASASDGSHRANVWIIPLSLRASLTATRALSLHVEGQYTHITGTGEARVDEIAVHGGAVSASVQLGAMAMYKLGRVVSLYARGRVQPWQRAARVQTHAQPDTYTTVETDADVQPIYAVGAWQALGGVDLSWGLVNLQLGAGYGDLFFPSLGVVVPYKGVVPDANLFFRF